MAIPIKKPKNQAAKRALEAREAKMVEDSRTALFMRGTSTSESITEILKNLHDLKKPDSRYFPRRNEKRPFEDDTSIEFLCQKNESSIFGYGSHSKKRPDNLILGRTYNYKIYDMYEFGLTNIKPMASFKASKAPSMCNQPLLLFQGDAFETDSKMAAVKNLFLDMYSHQAQKKINLAGVEHVIVMTAQGGKVAFRHYAIALKKSGGRVPRIELEEIGPSFDMELRRDRLPSVDLAKEASKMPKQVQKQAKMKKNLERNAMGETTGRVHMQKQTFDDFQTRKLKGLKRGRDKALEAKAEEAEAKRARAAEQEDV